MNKLVSIISPCYNGEKYISNFLDSVIKQRYRPLELIIIDDGSTDSTREIIKAYDTAFQNDGIILRYIYKQNGGQASAINYALPLFQGDYMMWCDSDDILLPDNVNSKVIFLEHNQDCGFVLSQGYVVYDDNIDDPVGILKRNHLSDEHPIRLFEDIIMERNVVYVPATIMVRRKNFVDSIPSLRICEGMQGQNFQLMLPLAYMSKAGYIDEPLFKYVIHKDSHSHTYRDYHQLINRATDFESIILDTIANIPTMNQNDYEYWKRFVKTKYARERLRLSYQHKIKSDYKRYRVQLYSLKSFGISDIEIVYRIRVATSNMWNRIKKKMS